MPGTLRQTRTLSIIGLVIVTAGLSLCQETASSPAAEPESKRLLGIIPNYRTSPSLQDYEPLKGREKFKLASEDALDRGTVILAGLFAGQGQLTNANQSFGQGGAGFGRYFGSAYGDLFIGDYMTESIFPTFLHQDPPARIL
jgi:hypothetical protein